MIKTKRHHRPGLFLSLLPIVFLVVFLAANVFVFDDTLAGSNQLILLFAATIAALIAHRHNVTWTAISEAIVQSIGRAMPALLILLFIGSLAGTWLLSGVVPAMIYYGLQIIHPKVFLFTAIVVCGVVSFATGSSWSTIATVGVALLGIGKALEMHEGLVAGAIISGAYFGDKMSPLSDTTNLAPAVAGTDLFTHIRYMLVTTVPSIAIALVIFLVIGLVSDYPALQTNVIAVSDSIGQQFNITPWLLMVPVLLIVIIVKKVPALPALMIGTLLGAVAAFIFQHDLILTLAEGHEKQFFFQEYEVVMRSMFGSLSIHSNNPIVADLLSTSGMAGMLHTVWLIISAMIFGGAMEAGYLIQRITQVIIDRVKSTGSLITSTIVTSIVMNFTASDQYISIVLPGKMFADSYQKRNLKPEVLSRTLEDGGTLTSVLVPWNTCGATQAKVLGVSTWVYAPYCFFNIINPIVAVVFAYLGYKVRYRQVSDKESEK